MPRWSHLPTEIKEGIRRAGFRPRSKECFVNCQRLVLFGDVPAAEYYEGVVRHDETGSCFAHAWLVFEGGIVDITLTGVTPVRGWPVPRDEILRLWIAGQAGPIRQDDLYKLEAELVRDGAEDSAQ